MEIVFALANWRKETFLIEERDNQPHCIICTNKVDIMLKNNINLPVFRRVELVHIQ